MEFVLYRKMKDSDWKAVKRIYESGIATGIATFEDSAPNWEKWNASHLLFARITAELKGQITGWGALSPVSDRCVYQGVAEVSVYVDLNYLGNGIGKKVMELMIEESEKNGIWTLQSRIFRENTASIQLHKNVGFREIGYRERIGKKNGVWKDNVIMERRSQLIGMD